MAYPQQMTTRKVQSGTSKEGSGPRKDAEQNSSYTASTTRYGQCRDSCGGKLQCAHCYDTYANSQPLYRTLHSSPGCRRDTRRRAAGPKPSAAMHLLTQLLLSLAYEFQKSRHTRHPDSCADFQETDLLQVGKDIVPIQPSRRKAAWVVSTTVETGAPHLSVSASPKSLASALRRVKGRYQGGSERGHVPL